MAKKDRIAAEQEAGDDAGLVFERFSLNGSAKPAGLGASHPDYGVWLVALGMAAAAVLVLVLVAMPSSRTTSAQATPLPDNEFTNIISSVQTLLTPSDHSLPVVLAKLVLAALLGAIVGYRQRIHVDEYIVQAHVIIAFTGALMMIIIGNEIVRAFGLLGAGSIIRYRTPVRDPRALASLFVTMGIGIAVGVGLFELAFIGAVLIVLIQGVFGRIASSLPSTLYNPQRGYTLSLTTEDGSGSLERIRQTFYERDIRYRLLEFDARAKKDGLVKMTMVVEANANLSTEELTLLVFRDGVQSVSWEEE
ncbi:MAG: MgtC/SapB family protein [Chloroflexi bacterium]|nr:MgtC/SapB family protein [Chloroflexota bacterium]